LLARTQFRYLRDNDNYLSNIISALVTQDWSGVVEQCTIDSWKEALVATLTYCNEQLPSLCEQLGERLENEVGHDRELAKNSILCYICAGSVERLVKAWQLRKPADADPQKAGGSAELQELVEVVMLFQKALELQGKQYEISGKLADLLTQYAGMLASQGCLSSALTYLASSQNPEIAETRDRLSYSLGYKQLAPTRMQPQNLYAPQKPQQAATLANRFTQPRGSLTNATPVNNYFGAPAQPPLPMPPPSQTPNQWNAAPMQPSVFQPPPPAASLPPPVSAPAQPPRPSSVNSQPGGISQRSKYVLDPSVQSGPAYGQSGPNMMYTPPTYNAQPAYGGMAEPAPQPNYNQFNTNPMNAGPQAGPAVFTPAAPQNNFQPFTPTQNFGQPQGQANVFNAPPQGSAFPPPPTHTDVQRNPTPPPGWNDPPALKTNRPPQVSVVRPAQLGVVSFFLSLSFLR
jgi:protein transport protein SEC31